MPAATLFAGQFNLNVGKYGSAGNQLFSKVTALESDS